MTLFDHLKIPGILISSLFLIIACQATDTNRIIEKNSPYNYQDTLLIWRLPSLNITTGLFTKVKLVRLFENAVMKHFRYRL